MPKHLDEMHGNFICNFQEFLPNIAFEASLSLWLFYGND